MCEGSLINQPRFFPAKSQRRPRLSVIPKIWRVVETEKASAEECLLGNEFSACSICSLSAGGGSSPMILQRSDGKKKRTFALFRSSRWMLGGPNHSNFAALCWYQGHFLLTLSSLLVYKMEG